MSLIDFAIVTGLLEEFKVVQKCFPELQPVPTDENAENWYRGQIQSETGKQYQVVASWQTQQGTLDAGDLTKATIRRWDPAYIILVGIAGSFHESVRLGDVIVSQQVFYYDPGVAKESGITYRPEGYPCSVTLIRQLQALALDSATLESWQDNAQTSARGKAEDYVEADAQDKEALVNHRPKIHFGTVASGSLVIASDRLKKKLLKLHGKIIGTESEGAGVMHASFAEELPTPAIVVKGIIDAANPQKAAIDKKGYWRELGKENSARLAKQLIRRGRIRSLQTDEITLDTTPGPLNECRQRIPDRSVPGVSLLGFPLLIKPKGPMTRIELRIAAYGVVNGTESSLAIARQVTDYTEYDGRFFQDKEISEVKLLKPLAKKPIGVYLMIVGTPSRIEFSVQGPFERKEATWNANARS